MTVRTGLAPNRPSPPGFSPLDRAGGVFYKAPLPAFWPLTGARGPR